MTIQIKIVHIKESNGKGKVKLLGFDVYSEKKNAYGHIDPT